MAGVRHFFSKVVGVTHENRDGTSRQAIIAGCYPTEKLDPKNEDDNPADENAVKLCRENGQQIGYLNAMLAEEIIRRSKKGYRYGIYITEITGGTKGKKHLGANLLIIVAEPGVSDREAQKYADKLGRDPDVVGRQIQPSEQNTGCLILLLAILVTVCGIGCILF